MRVMSNQLACASFEDHGLKSRKLPLVKHLIDCGKLQMLVVLGHTYPGSLER
jgi:hypothetical protein